MVMLESTLKEKGVYLQSVDEKDLEDFIQIENETHTKYVLEQKDFLGEYKEEVLVKNFELKMKMSFSQKVVRNKEIVGFLGYDVKDMCIDSIFIRLKRNTQNQGIGTLFLEYLKELSKRQEKPIFLAVIKTNPAQKLYRKLGFIFCKEENAFYHFKYENR